MFSMGTICLRNWPSCNNISSMLIRKKGEFGRTRIDYLGHVISGNGVEADPSKIQAMVD